MFIGGFGLMAYGQDMTDEKNILFFSPSPQGEIDQDTNKKKSLDEV
jgi:hypothetical protein